MKPICVVYIGKDVSQESADNFSKEINKAGISKEYWILFLSGEENKVEIFYEKNFNKVKFAELKKIISKKA